MKTLKLASIFIALNLGLGCASTKNTQHSAEVEILSRETGAITVKSVGYGNSRVVAIADAQKNAFRVILFTGFPDNSPLIENESVARQKSNDYFQRFFAQDYYKTFMMSSTESSNLIRTDSGNKISVDVKVNTAALRKNLEQNEVVRKFGY